MKYGEPRYTKDLDVWVHNSAPNSMRVVQALKEFGAPLDYDGIDAETFAGKQVVYQIGVAPVRVDILTDITAVEFSDAWKKKVASSFFGVPVHFISLAGCGKTRFEALAAQGILTTVAGRSLNYAQSAPENSSIYVGSPSNSRVIWSPRT
jgi:hypothetical protein